MNGLISFLIEGNYEPYYSYLLNNYTSEFNYFVVAKSAIKTRNVKLCDMSFSHLNQTELNKLLGWINVIDIELMKLLIKYGAQFEVDNYNDQTMKKVNAMIKAFTEGKES
jgi:ankyrin repeat protein